MFNIGPMELLVLAIVGIVVLGPERLPGLARDAARLLRALREVAQGARSQLQDELGPELADLDLRNLNPKTALRRAVLGDDFDSGFSADDYRFNPKQLLQGLMDEEPSAPVTLTKADSNGAGTTAVSAETATRRRPRPYPSTPPVAPAPDAPAPYDPDTT